MSNLYEVEDISAYLGARYKREQVAKLISPSWFHQVEFLDRCGVETYRIWHSYRQRFIAYSNLDDAAKALRYQLFHRVGRSPLPPKYDPDEYKDELERRLRHHPDLQFKQALSELGIEDARNKDLGKEISLP